MEPNPDAGTEAGASMAIDTPAVRRRILLAEIAGVGCVVVAVGLLVALAVTWSIMRPRFLARQDELLHVPGSIVNLHDSGGEDSDLIATVRFGFDGDHLRTADVVGVGEDRWSEGQEVTVLVDPDTGVVTLPGENYVPESFWALTAAVIIAALAIGGFGVWGWRRAALRRRRVALRMGSLSQDGYSKWPDTWLW